MILIGVPCNDSMKSRTAFSLCNLEGNISFVFQMGADVADNRNKLVTHLLSGDYTHILFVDSDMSFGPKTLREMYARDEDILGLAANHRRLPLESVVKPLDGDITKPLPTKLFEAESCGLGVMLIKREVFEKIEAPWFEFTYDPERVSEDVNFCRKAREEGYKIMVDPSIPIRHCGEYLF